MLDEVNYEDDYEGLNGCNTDYFNPWLMFFKKLK